jgi:hypothetical protein
LVQSTNLTILPVSDVVGRAKNATSLRPGASGVQPMEVERARRKGRSLKMTTMLGIGGSG